MKGTIFERETYFRSLCGLHYLQITGKNYSLPLGRLLHKKSSSISENLKKLSNENLIFYVPASVKKNFVYINYVNILECFRDYLVEISRELWEIPPTDTYYNALQGVQSFNLNNKYLVNLIKSFFDYYAGLYLTEHDWEQTLQSHSLKDLFSDLKNSAFHDSLFSKIKAHADRWSFVEFLESVATLQQTSKMHYVAMIFENKLGGTQ